MRTIKICTLLGIYAINIEDLAILYANYSFNKDTDKEDWDAARKSILEDEDLAYSIIHDEVMGYDELKDSLELIKPLQLEMDSKIWSNSVLSSIQTQIGKSIECHWCNTCFDEIDMLYNNYDVMNKTVEEVKNVDISTLEKVCPNCKTVL